MREKEWRTTTIEETSSQNRGKQEEKTVTIIIFVSHYGITSEII